MAKKSKPVTYSLEVCFVQAYRMIEQKNYLNQTTRVREGVGDYHIFETFKDEFGDRQRKPTSYCDKASSDIAKAAGVDDAGEQDVRPTGQCCPECEKNWKADPRSPWFRYMQSVGAKP